MFKSIAKSTSYIATQVQSVAVLTEPAISALAHAVGQLEITAIKAYDESLIEAGLTIEAIMLRRQIMREGSLTAQLPSPKAK